MSPIRLLRYFIVIFIVPIAAISLAPFVPYSTDTARHIAGAWALGALLFAIYSYYASSQNLLLPLMDVLQEAKRTHILRLMFRRWNTDHYIQYKHVTGRHKHRDIFCATNETNAGEKQIAFYAAPASVPMSPPWRKFFHGIEIMPDHMLLNTHLVRVTKPYDPHTTHNGYITILDNLDKACTMVERGEYSV